MYRFLLPVVGDDQTCDSCHDGNALVPSFKISANSNHPGITCRFNFNVENGSCHFSLEHSFRVFQGVRTTIIDLFTYGWDSKWTDSYEINLTF